MITVTQAISLLNGTVPNGLTGIQRVMLMNAVQDAARKGDKAAREFITLCELNVSRTRMH
jgi:hypothetical protein